jgi:hypothetical protein
MTNSNEIAALVAAYRGAVSTTDALGADAERMSDLNGATDIDPALLEELSRLTAAHAIAAAALRGLVESMQRRRAAPAP